MNKYTVIAGVNGTGKSSLRGVLESQGLVFGHIVDADLIAKKNHFDILKAGKNALLEIKTCFDNNISLTQETTLSGNNIKSNMQRARKQGYYISMFYVGVSSCEECLSRIESRVKKGGHDIPKNDVIRRFNSRFDTLKAVALFCDEITFFDNENGFREVAQMKNGIFAFSSDYRPEWIEEINKIL